MDWVRKLLCDPPSPLPETLVVVITVITAGAIHPGRSEGTRDEPLQNLKGVLEAHRAHLSKKGKGLCCSMNSPKGFQTQS